jgi:hypothetical protein
MSKAIFNAQVIVQSSIPQADPTVFDIVFNIQDFEGAFDGTSVQVNDILFLDTSAIELGTITKYQVQSVISQDTFTVEATVKFFDNNDYVIDPGNAAGVPGFISRPTANYGLNIAAAPGTQLLPDKFFAYPENYNMESLDADLQTIGGGGANTTLSNLTSPTAVNQDLLPANTQTLGNVSSPWSYVYASNLINSGNLSVTSSAGNVTIEGEAINVVSGNNSQLKLYSDSSLLIYAKNGQSQVQIWGSSTRLFDASGNTYVDLIAPNTSVGYALTLPVDAGTLGQVLQTDGLGNLSWVTSSGGGSGANTALSNLTDTSINQDLISSMGNNLGSPSHLWGTTYTQNLGDVTSPVTSYVSSLHLTDGTNDLAELKVDTLPDGSHNVVVLRNYQNNLPLGLMTENLPSGITASIYLMTGNSNTGNSGDLVLSTGQAPSGTRGSVRLTGNTIDFNSSPFIDVVTIADPLDQISINVESRYLIDSTDVVSVSYDNRHLVDASNNVSIDWSSRLLKLSNGNAALDYSSSLDFKVSAYLDAGTSLNFTAASGGSVGFQAPLIATPTTWTLPSADGTSGQVLTTDGLGTLSWSTASGGGSQWGTNGSNIYYNFGNVGIGTDSPATTLEVVGSARISDINYPTTDGNAGQVLATDGAGNLSFVTPASSSNWTKYTVSYSDFLRFEDLISFKIFVPFISSFVIDMA